MSHCIPSRAVWREGTEADSTGPVRLARTRLLGIHQVDIYMLKMQLWPGGDSGAIWPDSGGLLPQRERAGKKK